MTLLFLMCYLPIVSVGRPGFPIGVGNDKTTVDRGDCPTTITLPVRRQLRIPAEPATHFGPSKPSFSMVWNSLLPFP